MHPELLVRKRIWLMTLVLTGLFLLAAARTACLRKLKSRRRFRS